MNVTLDVSYKSLNKHHEELCGDKVELLTTEDSNIIILADGMGSGVKANILATLTSKILGTMFLNGANLEECIQTVAKTLPVCKVRQVAYSTFSILQVFHNGEAYLVEFDNPACVFIRDKKLAAFPYLEREIEGKRIREYRFTVQKDDCFILMSDGVIHAGVGQALNFGWTWDSMASYSVKATNETLSAARLAAILSGACNDLYMNLPGDDTTIAVARVIPRKNVLLLTGPPKDKENDERVVHDFLSCQGTHIVSGGTSANIVSRVTNQPIHASLTYTNANIPPTATIKGIDLVTEGVLTLSRSLHLMKQYMDKEVSQAFFVELDQADGGSQIAKILIEECTELTLFVGQAVNEAHQNPNLPIDLNIRMHLVEQIASTVKRMGKKVILKYY